MLWGESDATGQAPLKKRRPIPREAGNGVEAVLRALAHQRRRGPKTQRIGEALKDFRRNRHRMRYAEVKAQHLPIGSGGVEAACTTLVTQPLKRSGMRWRHDGGQTILTLRALIQSGRFAHAWEWLSSTYRQEGNIPDNVIAFPRKRAA